MRVKTLVELLAIMAAVSSASCSPEGTPIKPGYERLTFEGKTGVLFAEVAATEAKRNLGLGYRKKLPQDQGLLLLYRESARQRVTMRNVTIPLDLAYLENDGTVIEILAMDPEEGGGGSRSYGSSKKVRYALQVNQGWFAEQGITVGVRFRGLPSLAQARVR